MPIDLPLAMLTAQPMLVPLPMLIAHPVLTPLPMLIAHPALTALPTLMRQPPVIKLSAVVRLKKLNGVRTASNRPLAHAPPTLTGEYSVAAAASLIALS